MKRAVIFMFVILLQVVDNGFSQPEVDWVYTCGGERMEGYAKAIALDNGNLALAGTSRAHGRELGDLWLVVVDQNGEEVWNEVYGEEAPEECVGIISTNDGGFALIGITGFWSILVKADEDGEEEWFRTFEERPAPWFYSALQNANNEYIIGGFQGGNVLLMSTDENGEEQWSRDFGGDGDDYCFSIIQDVNDEYILAGYTESFGNGWDDFYLICVNSEGEEQWSQTYGRDGSEQCQSVIQTDDDGYILAGYSTSFGEGDEDGWVVKVNSAGEEEWSRAFVEEGDNRFNDIIQTADGGYAIAGYLNMPDMRFTDFWLVKVDEHGEELWTLTWGDVSSDQCFSIVQTEDFGYALSGFTSSVEGNSFDFGLVKTTPDPDLIIPQWSVLPDTSLFEDDTLSINSDYFHDFISSPVCPDSLLTLAVEAGRFVNGIIVDDELRIYAPEHWNGSDSLIISASDPDDNVAFTVICIVVNPLNDLPGEFALINPTNQEVILDNTIDFIWHEASQNQWEKDDVTYSLLLQNPEIDVQTEHLFSGLVDTCLNNIPVDSLVLWVDLDMEDDTSEVIWHVIAVDDSGRTECDQAFSFFLQINNIRPEEIRNYPYSTCLFSAFPNPFNSTTTIEYALPYTSEVTLSLYNLSGQRVETLVDGRLQVGVHRVMLDAGDMASGLYFVKLEGAGQSFTRKLMLVK